MTIPPTITAESELVARLRDLAQQIDPCDVGGPDARLLTEAAATIERLASAHELTATDLKYLRAISSEGYADFANDPAARKACKRLAELGYCRVTEDGPAWRVMQSPDHMRLAIRALSPPEKPDEGHPHLISGEFQSDKYPTCPRGKVPLSVKDRTAQDLLWEYAQRRRPVDAEFAADLEIALKAKGYVAPPEKGERIPSGEDSGSADAGLKYCSQHPKCEGPTLIVDHASLCPDGGMEDCDNDHCWVPCTYCVSEGSSDAIAWALVRDLRQAGSIGLDMSPGDPLCARAATWIERRLTTEAASPPPAKAEDGMREALRSAADAILRIDGDRDWSNTSDMTVEMTVSIANLLRSLAKEGTP